MIRSLFTIVCLCLFITGCTYPHYVYKVESIEQWKRSPVAQRGYVYLSGDVTSDKASNVVNKMVVLNDSENVERIRLVISTTGGKQQALNTIINQITKSDKPVDIICIGSCYGTGIVLYAAATGKRYAFPNTDFIMHRGKSNNKKAEVEKVLQFESEKYETLLKENSDLPDKLFPLEKKWIFFTDKEAKKYNMTDEIITEMP